MNLTRTCAILSLLVCSYAQSKEEFAAFLKLTQYEYDEFCNKSAQVEWIFVNKPTNQTRRLWVCFFFPFLILLIFQMFFIRKKIKSRKTEKKLPLFFTSLCPLLRKLFSISILSPLKSFKKKTIFQSNPFSFLF